MEQPWIAMVAALLVLLASMASVELGMTEEPEVQLRDLAAGRRV